LDQDFQQRRARLCPDPEYCQQNVQKSIARPSSRLEAEETSALFVGCLLQSCQTKTLRTSDEGFAQRLRQRRHTCDSRCAVLLETERKAESISSRSVFVCGQSHESKDFVSWITANRILCDHTESSQRVPFSLALKGKIAFGSIS
jgi:hypothetical protein